MSDPIAENPLTDRAERIIRGNAALQQQSCPNDDCGCAVRHVDVRADDGTMIVVHEGDSRADDYCDLPAEADPTVETAS